MHHDFLLQFAVDLQRSLLALVHVESSHLVYVVLERATVRSEVVSMVRVSLGNDHLMVKVVTKRLPT